MSADLERQLTELRAAHARLDELYRVVQTLHSTLDPQRALDLILQEAVRLTHASSGSVALINPNDAHLEIQASYRLPTHATTLRLRVGQGITGWVALHGQPACVADVSQDPRYHPVRPGVRSELAVPLAIEGQIRGVINVDSDRPNAFTQAHQTLLEALALPAALAIHNSWLYEQLRLKAALFEALFNVGQTINSTLALDDALQTITRETAGLMRAKLCSLLLVDPTGQWLDLRASHGAGPAYRHKPRLPIAESLLGTVVRRARPLQVQNVQTSPSYHSQAIAQAEGLVSLLSVPLTYRHDVIGTLNVYTATPYTFSNEEIRILSALADLSAIAIQKARLYERLLTLEEQLRRTEQLSTLGLIAAEVAHEIRNPLAVIQMLFDSLDLRFPQHDPRHRDLQVIRRKIHHINRIMEQILHLARHSEPRFEPVHINQLIDDLLLIIRHRLSAQNVQVQCTLDPHLPSVMADPAHLEQAFLNLALNALDAMPHGGRLHVTTRPIQPRLPHSHRRWVAIQFSDTGPGIPPHKRPRSDQSFLRSDKPGGTGLGLVLVNRALQAHHGRLRIFSHPGHGTAVTLLLPA